MSGQINDQQQQTIHQQNMEIEEANRVRAIEAIEAMHVEDKEDSDVGGEVVDLDEPESTQEESVNESEEGEEVSGDEEELEEDPEESEEKEEEGDSEEEKEEEEPEKESASVRVLKKKILRKEREIRLQKQALEEEKAAIEAYKKKVNGDEFDDFVKAQELAGKGDIDGILKLTGLSPEFVLEWAGVSKDDVESTLEGKWKKQQEELSNKEREIQERSEKARFVESLSSKIRNDEEKYIFIGSEDPASIADEALELVKESVKSNPILESQFTPEQLLEKALESLEKVSQDDFAKKQKRLEKFGKSSSKKEGSKSEKGSKSSKSKGKAEEVSKGKSKKKRKTLSNSTAADHANPRVLSDEELRQRHIKMIEQIMSDK